MEKPQENIIEEVKNPKKGNNFNVPIVPSPELDDASEDLLALGQAIDRDLGVGKENLEKIDNSLRSVKVTVGGMEFTVEDAEKIPDLKMNMGIWKEIENGNDNNVNKLTHLTPNITDCLVELYRNKFMPMVLLSQLKTLPDEVAKRLANINGQLYLDRLTHISDVVAEFLGCHPNRVVLNGLTHISDIAAENLSKNEHDIWLDGLTSLSNKTAESLAKCSGSLRLWGLITLSDEVAERLSQYTGNYLGLHNLRTISDKAAKYFAKEFKYLDAPEVEEQIRRFKKR